MKSRLITHFFVPFALLLFLITSCKKDSESVDPISSTDSTSVVLKENVYVIDSTKLVLDSTSSEFSTGQFVYIIQGTAPDYKMNDIIVGSTGEGYIRKVTSK